MDTISLCMITRNEEEVLAQCLDSVRTLVDEIVIVDTGSTDRTVAIAKSYGARIYQHPWEDNYSTHRNQSIAYATGVWILVMDADEVIAARDRDKIRTLLETVRADGFIFTLRNYERTANLANLILNAGDYPEGAGFPGYIGCDLIRLFRNDPSIYFTGQVHETVTRTMTETKKVLFTTGIPIHHYGKVRGDRVQRKQQTYLALGRERLRESPRDPAAYKGLCDQLLELGMPGDALGIAEQGLALFPEMPELHFNRGLALDRMGIPGEAEREYRWTLARQPDHLGACHNLGQILWKGGQGEEAVQLLNRGIAGGIRHPALFLLLGQVHADAGESAKALDNYARVLELHPGHPDVRCHMAVLFLNNQRYPEAIDALESEIAHGGNLVGAYNLLGQISLHGNDSESAGKFFRKVLTIDPANPTATDYLKRLAASKHTTFP